MFFALVASGAESSEIITDEAGIARVLMGKEAWGPGEVLYSSIAAGPPMRAYTSRLACGSGTCPQYLFDSPRPGRWRLIGTVSGRITTLPSQTNGHPDLTVESRVGPRADEGTVETFVFNGERYVPR